MSIKTILSHFNGENIKKNILKSTKRFPIAVCSSLIGALFAFILLHGDLDVQTSEYITRWVFSLVIVFFLSIGTTLYGESRKKKDTFFQILYIAPVIFGGMFFTSFLVDIDSFENFVFFCITLAWIIWLLFFAPYIKNVLENSGEQSIYYTFFYRMSVIFLISFILWWVLFSLWAIGISAVVALFDLSIGNGKIYGDWAIISLSVFTPIFALTQIPSSKDFSENHLNENPFFSFLVKYVAIPFIMIYFFILYAYSIKVLLNFSDWPKGEVSWMVIGFSTFWYITYIFSYIFEQKNALIKNFRKYFPYAVAPQIIMLFYAISLRIWQYDITVNRYFVVVFGLWLSVISLYFIISKRKYIGYIPAILTLFSLIISIGPWSVYNLPENRQLKRLTQNLIEANILQGQEIVPLNDSKDISQELSGEIYDGIKYICNINDCSSIKEIFKEQYSKYEVQHKIDFEEDQELYPEIYGTRNYSTPSKWQVVEHITDYIKVVPTYNYTNTPKYLSYSISHNKSIFPLEIQWFNKVLQVSPAEQSAKSGERIQIDTEKKQLSLYIWNILSATTDISGIIDSIVKNPAWELPISEVYHDISSGEIQGRLILTDVSIPNPKHTDNSHSFYKRVSWYFLVK